MPMSNVSIEFMNLHQNIQVYNKAHLTIAMHEPPDFTWCFAYEHIVIQIQIIIHMINWTLQQKPL